MKGLEKQAFSRGFACVLLWFLLKYCLKYVLILTYFLFFEKGCKRGGERGLSTSEGAWRCLGGKVKLDGRRELE